MNKKIKIGTLVGVIAGLGIGATSCLGKKVDLQTEKYSYAKKVQKIMEMYQKIEKELESNPLTITLPGWLTVYGNEENFRQAVVLLDDFDKDGKIDLGIGISHKNDLYFGFFTETEFELFDYGKNGYGSVDSAYQIEEGGERGFSIDKKNWKSVTELYHIIIDQTLDSMKKAIDKLEGKEEKEKKFGKDINGLVEKIKK